MKVRGTINFPDTATGDFLSDDGTFQSIPAEESLFSTYSNDLVVAVGLIGSTPTTLLIDADTTLSVPVSIPSNIGFVRKNDAVISLTGIGALEFEDKVVKGNEIGFIRHSGSLPRMLWFNWTGVSGNHLTFASHGYSTGQQLRFAVWRHGPQTSTYSGIADEQIVYAIRVDANTLAIASTYANALANVQMTWSTLSGTYHFFPVPVAWTGDVPDVVSHELIDTGTNSISVRLKMLTRGLQGRSVWIEVESGGTQDDCVLMADNHSLRFKSGIHQSAFSGNVDDPSLTFAPFTFPIVLGSDAIWTSERGATIMESSVNYKTALGLVRWGAQNSTITGNYFKGQGAFFDGVTGGIQFDYGYNNHVLHNTFDTLSSYVISIVPSGQDGRKPDHCSAKYNLLKNTITQILFNGGGDFVDFMYNYIDCRNFDPVVDGTFSFVDYEPNDEHNTINNCRFNYNVIDARGIINLGYLVSYVNVNSVGTAGYRNLEFIGNWFISNNPTGTQDNHLRNGIVLYGSEDVVIQDNRFFGMEPLSGPININLSRKVRVINNTSSNGSGRISIAGSTEVEVTGQRHWKHPDGFVDQPEEIVEAQNGLGIYPVDTITGDTIRLYYAIAGSPSGYDGNLYQHFKGMRGYLNEIQYTVSNITLGSFFGGDTHTQATLTPSITGLNVPVVVPSSDVDTATNLIHKVAHGFNDLAAVYYTPGTAAMTNIQGYSNHWIHVTDADHFGLCLTYEDAQNGIIEDIQSQGTGNQTFNLSFAVYPYGNDFHENPGLPVTYAPHSNSLDRTPSTTEIIVADNTATPDLTKSGSAFDNSGATGMLTILLNKMNAIGKEYRLYVADTKGIQALAGTSDTITDLGVESELGGFIQSHQMGANLLLKRMSNTWAVLAKSGDWYTLRLTGATRIIAMDLGRSSGGVVGGYDQESGVSGGTDASWTAYTPKPTPYRNPAPDAVYQTFLNANTSFDVTATGLDNTKGHVVRIHIIAGYEFSGAGSDISILIDGDKMRGGIDVVTMVGVQKVVIFEYFLKAGISSTTVTIAGPVGSYQATASALEVWELP
jgi:hypothetical protein